MEDNFIDLGEMTDTQFAEIFGDKPNSSEKKDNTSAEGNKEITEPPKKEPEDKNPENVGNDEGNSKAEEGTANKGGSPNQVTSIAKAFEGSAFQTLKSERLDQIKTPEDFDKAMEEELSNRLTERQRRIEEALNYKVPQTTIQQYENSLKYLEGIDDKILEDDSNEQSNDIRKNIIFTSYILDGVPKDRAKKLTLQSFEAGSDIEDAKEALPLVKQKYTDGYNKVINDAKEAEQARINADKKYYSDIEDSIMKDEGLFKQLEINDITRKKIYENISKPAFTDEDGKSYTSLQKYMKDNPVESNKIIGMLYTVTDGFKDFEGLLKGKVQKATKKEIDKLSKAFNNLSGSFDGNMSLVDGNQENTKTKKFDVTKDFDIVFNN